MSTLLHREIADYTARRDRLASAILDFSDWLDRHGGVDAERNLRLLDAADALKKDRLTLVFAGESSRGKSELINALFFADLGLRLLPSGSRASSCPVEMYFDPEEEPGLRLLPVESRLRAESLALLKLQPIDWSRTGLDLRKPDQLAETLRVLHEVKRVPADLAQELGLLEDGARTRAVREDGMVEIPAWRYAMINLPHPLLKAGLIILDFPGFSALGAEPELTLSAIPNAHAVLFLLGADTGVAQSDLEIWQKQVHRHPNYHLAVLNKIDLLGDDSSSCVERQEIVQRQLEAAARILKLPIGHVFGVSAQEALAGRIGNDAGLIARSGIVRLEQMLGNTVIPARREIVSHAALQEIRSMLEIQRSGLSERTKSIALDWQTLSGLSGKSKGAIRQLHEQMVKDKRRYDAAADAFKGVHRSMMLQGEELMNRLSIQDLDQALKGARLQMEESWTTNGLIQGMREVAELVKERFSKASLLSGNMRNYLAQAIERFEREHGLAAMALRPLDLEPYQNRIDSLVNGTEVFCKDPANLLVEKRFMIRRFHTGVINEVRKTYTLAIHDARQWLHIAMEPVKQRIMENKALLDERLDDLKKSLADMDHLKTRMESLKTEMAGMKNRRSVLDDIAARLKD